MTNKEALRELDEAVTRYFHGSGGAGEFVTGWVLSASVKHPAHQNSDGYFTQHSEGLPYHSQLGLLVAALEEKQNLVLINTMKGMN